MINYCRVGGGEGDDVLRDVAEHEAAACALVPAPEPRSSRPDAALPRSAEPAGGALRILHSTEHTPKCKINTTIPSAQTPVRTQHPHSEHHFQTPSSRLPELVTPLKTHYFSPHSCLLTLSVPSERFRY